VVDVSFLKSPALDLGVSGSDESTNRPGGGLPSTTTKQDVTATEYGLHTAVGVWF